MNVTGLSTPAVVVDLDVVERNLARMASYCREHGIALRPHTKTHKSVEMAKRQLAHGALGLTVAKVGEAEVMAQTGARQILVAHPIIGEAKVRRLAKLTEQVEILVAVDSVEAAEGLSRVAAEQACTFGILIEFDSGSHRCGVPAGAACAALGQAVAQLPGLQVRGLFTYFGSVWGSEADRSAEMQSVAEHVALAREAFANAGLSLEIVSAGSTPAAAYSHLVPGITEIRTGTYIYNDLNTLYQGLCAESDCAVRVLTTVVSTAIPGQAIVDAGSKTFSSDTLGSGTGTGYGLASNGAELSKLNEEHGFLLQGEHPLRVGEVLSVLPNHVCTCINMHDAVHLVRGGEVLETMRVDARGKVS